MFNTFGHIRRTSSIETLLQERADLPRHVKLNAIMAVLHRTSLKLNDLPSGVHERQETFVKILLCLLALESLFRLEGMEGALMREYGDGCLRCRHSVCICQVERRDTVVAEETQERDSLPRQAPERIGEWQDFLAKLYPNAELDALGVFMRFMSEVHELGSAVYDKLLERNKYSLQQEIAQVFGWLCAYATKRDLRLEEFLRYVNRHTNNWKTAYHKQLPERTRRVNAS